MHKSIANAPVVARPSRRFATLVAASTLLAACATRPDIEWSAPDIAGQSGLLRGANVLVACEAPDVALRNVCQDQLAAAARRRGSNPVFVRDDTTLVAGRPFDEQLLQGARSANAAAIVVVSLRPVATEESSPFSLSLGGFGFGRGSAIGGGIAAPIGDSRVATGFAGNGRVTNVGTGKLVWTASASSSPSEDLPRQLSSLSTTILDSAARAGLF